MSDQNTEKEEILVVTSKVKKYIKTQSGMSTSEKAVDLLSQRVKKILDLAIEHAKSDGRKTIMDRDIG